MKKEQAYKLIASSFGIGNIKTQANLWASAVAFILAMLVKQFDGFFPYYMLVLVVSIIASYVSILGLQKRNIETNIVANDFAGVWIALCFPSGNIILNLFAFSSYLLISFFKPVFSKIQSRLSFSQLNMRTSIISGFAGSILSYSVLLLLYILK